MGERRNVYLVTNWKSEASFTTRLLYPRGKCHQYTLIRSLGGPQGRSGRFGEEVSCLLALADSPTRSLVVITTTLSQLMRLSR